jgi:outer membrane protein assembly factor BamE
VLALLGGCQSFDGGRSWLDELAPYRIEVVQGNVLTKERLAALKPGMSREEVIDILGTPLLTDPFHANRWDYVFTIRRSGAPEQKRTATVFFNQDTFDRIEAQDLPTERAFVAAIDVEQPKTRPARMELSEAERAGFQRAPEDQTLPRTDVPVVKRQYPPLENAP